MILDISFLYVQLPQLCEGLKNVGNLLEANYKDKLDRLQMFLTELVKDVNVDIILKLKVLEIIELRIMGWKVTSKVEDYYRGKISQFEENKRRSQVQTLVGSQSVRSSASTSNDPSVSGKDPSSKLPKFNRSDDLRFQTSVHELFPDTNLRERECVIVDGVKLFVSSTSSKLLKDAKAILTDHLVRQSSANKFPSSNVHYSREDLLSLASAPTSSLPPDQVKLSVISNSCPEILCKVKVRCIVC